MSTRKLAMRDDVPPLEDGDRLSRDEFERRYHAMPYVKKAELIEGVVHMPSPVRIPQHANPHLHLACWIGNYEAFTPIVRGADNGTVRLDEKNEPQPDGMLFLNREKGGQSPIGPDGYLEGAPEFAAEVAASSVSIDLHAKKNAYQRNGVREYLVRRVLEDQIDWFVSRAGQFEPLLPDASGVVRSEVFPGLWLNVPAMIRGDMPAVLATLQQGLASPEHAAFLKRHA